MMTKAKKENLRYIGIASFIKENDKLYNQDKYRLQEVMLDNCNKLKSNDLFSY